MNQIINDIFKNNDIPPLIFFFGEEDFLIEEASIAVVKKLLKDDNDKFNFDTFDGEEDEQLKISEIASSYPMMSNKRVVYIKRFHKLFSPRGSKKDENTPLGRYLKSPSKDTIMIVNGAPDSLKGYGKIKNDSNKIEKKISSTRFPYNILLLNGYWHEFSKIYESNIPKWIINKLETKGYKIEPRAADLLLALTNPDLRSINNELDKLILFLKDKNKTITLEDVNDLSGANREFSIFELQKVIGQRDMKRSIDILIKMQKNSDQSILITTMLGRYFTALLVLFDERNIENNDYKLASKVGISPFFVKEYISALHKYKPEELDNALIKITEADLKLKTSSGSKLSILQEMLISIIDK